MVTGQKAARVGIDSEKDIIRLINSNNSFNTAIKKSLETLGLGKHSNISASKGSAKTKADIILENDATLGISVKSTTETSFHHLDRRWLKDWKAPLNMPNEIFDIFQQAILRIAKDSKAKFILLENGEKVKKFLSDNLKIIINEIFRRDEEELKLFMVNDKRKRKIYLFHMEEVVSFLIKNATDNICFSLKGIVYLGDFISIQRKSGDGKHIIIPKTDLKHPGNQLQFKFSPLEFAEHIENTGTIHFFKLNH